jgi:hypothetical protein
MNKVETVVIGPPGAQLPPGTKFDGIELIEPADETQADNTPAYVVAACVFMLAAAGLAVGGVFVLFGLGWSMLAGAVACASTGVVLMRGLNNA